MKTAKKIVVAVELQCPYCDETIVSPGGSMFWMVAETGSTKDTLKCFHCGKQSKFPKV